MEKGPGRMRLDCHGRGREVVRVVEVGPAAFAPAAGRMVVQVQEGWTVQGVVG
jgi:hypothetical protein